MSGSKMKAYLDEKRRSFFDTTSEPRRKQTSSLEQIARETINQTYHEDDPSVAEWFKELVPSSAGVAEYISELFPSAQWIRRYNVSWLVGDLIAGTLPNDSKLTICTTDITKGSLSVSSLCRRLWRMRS